MTRTMALINNKGGVGKTTSIAKMTKYFIKQKKSVVLAAGDTFRAAATEQLNMWAERLKAKIVKQGEGADSASVVFDNIGYVKFIFGILTTPIVSYFLPFGAVYIDVAVPVCICWELFSGATFGMS